MRAIRISQGINLATPANNTAALAPYGAPSASGMQVLPTPTVSASAPVVQEFQQRLHGHDWFYDYSKDLHVFEKGYHNEQAMRSMVETHGGALKTIWETEHNRHRPKH